jgi:hypothetical protein
LIFLPFRLCLLLLACLPTNLASRAYQLLTSSSPVTSSTFSFSCSSIEACRQPRPPTSVTATFGESRIEVWHCGLLDVSHSTSVETSWKSWPFSRISSPPRTIQMVRTKNRTLDQSKPWPGWLECLVFCSNHLPSKMRVAEVSAISDITTRFADYLVKIR